VDASRARLLREPRDELLDALAPTTIIRSASSSTTTTM